jgi:hypothetical protein
MRICTVDDCSQPVWGTDKKTRTGYCKGHQFKRTDLKKQEYKPQKKIDRKSKRIPYHKIEWGFTSQVDLFMDLWEKSRNEHGIVVCKYSGHQLNGYETAMDRWLCCFGHLIPKKNYPLFKLNPENIRVILPEFHSIVDQGRISDRAKHPNWEWDLWDNEVLEMKEKYLQFKKDNLLA